MRGWKSAFRPWASTPRRFASNLSTRSICKRGILFFPRRFPSNKPGQGGRFCQCIFRGQGADFGSGPPTPCGESLLNPLFPHMGYRVPTRPRSSSHLHRCGRRKPSPFPSRWVGDPAKTQESRKSQLFRFQRDSVPSFPLSELRLGVPLRTLSVMHFCPHCRRLFREKGGK
jgi:hypothetical protein